MSDRRYLITIGSPECPGCGLAVLRRVAGDVERIARFFTGPEQGYEHALARDLPLGATGGQIQDSLCEWFAREDRREQDCVVVYVAGHGDSGVKFRDHALLVKDSDPRRASSVIRTADLVRWFFDGEGERPQNVLLILDVCYAGQGGGEAGAELVKAEARALRGGGAGFWVIATADSNTEAGDGAFVDAFLDVMNDEAWVARGGARFLSPDALSVAVNERLQQGQQSVVYGVGIGRVEAPFIRNPRFTRDLDGVSIADRAHWDPKARGVDAPSAPGWFFTGRRQALRDLSAWLKAERSDLRARVVTGGPGSGKSAVLGWLVLAARGETRQGMREAGLLDDPSLVPPLESVAARIHARGMRLGEMTRSLAALLASAARDPAALIAELSARPGPIGIVVDSLDEAAEATAIERELLAGLATCPAVRLIVGGRKRNGRPPLAAVAAVVDLDATDYFKRADLAAYVFSRLTSPSAAYAPEPRHADARRIAARVAERAGYSFLYARLVSRSLSAGAPLATGRAGWEAALKLPQDLTDAFGADLDRFDQATRRRFVDLFVPLAYARGKGLPQKNVWAAVASRIAGREYTNADLRDLKEQAGFYLVQDTESGEVVFRLFHQTFADYLKDLTRDEDVERTFAQALLALLPPPLAGDELWSQVGEPYILNHFPSHASAGGLLEEQLGNPGFLLRTPPEALLPELHRTSSMDARRIARAYRRASHWIRSDDDDASLTYLLWGACQHGAQALAERLRALLPRLPWHPEWAVWQEVVSGHILGQTETAVTALTTGEDDLGNPVTICGYEDGVIRVWSLVTSECLLEIRSRQGTAAGVQHLASAAIGRKLIAAAWDDGSLGVFDLHDGSELGWIQNGGKENRVRALCVIPEPPEGLLVTASDFSLFVWRMPSLELIRKRENAVAASFFSLASLDLRGEAAVVSGTDTVEAGEDTEKWPVRVWRVRDLRLLWSPDVEMSIASEIRSCKVGETNWIVARPYVGDLTFLNPSTHGQLKVHRPWDEELSSLMGFDRRGSEVLLIGQRFSRLRVFRLRPDDDGAGETLAVEDLPVRTEVRGGLWSDVIQLNGRSTLVSSDDRRIRVWDVQELLTDGAGGGEHEAPFGREESALAAVAAHDPWIVTGNIGDGFSDLRLWDVGGRLLWSRRFPQETLQKLALAEVDGSLVIVCGTGEGVLHVVHHRDGTDIRDPVKVGREIHGLTVRKVQGRPTAFLAVNLKPLGQEGEYVVRVWDLLTGEEIDTTKRSYSVANARQYQLAGFGYYRTKILWCVDALEWRGSTLVALAGPHGEVTVMGLETLKAVHRWKGGSTGDYVRSLAMQVCDGRPLVFGGDDNGRLFAHDLETGRDLCPRLDRAHRGGVAALRVQQTEAGACVASAGRDGVVRLWKADLTHLARIETERPVTDLAFVGGDRLAVATDRGLTLLRLDWELLFSRSPGPGRRSNP